GLRGVRLRQLREAVCYFRNPRLEPPLRPLLRCAPCACGSRRYLRRTWRQVDPRSLRRLVLGPFRSRQGCPRSVAKPTRIGFVQGFQESLLIWLPHIQFFNSPKPAASSIRPFTPRTS